MTVKDVCYKLVEELTDKAEGLWWEEYYKPHKFEKMHKLIAEFNKKFEENSCGFKATLLPKAISTHIRSWTGHRRARDGDYQYCLQWYGGYVQCIEFDGLPFKEFMKFLEEER